MPYVLMEITILVLILPVSWDFHGTRLSEQALIPDSEVDGFSRSIERGVVIVSIFLSCYPSHLLQRDCLGG